MIKKLTLCCFVLVFLFGCALETDDQASQDVVIEETEPEETLPEEVDEPDKEDTKNATHDIEVVEEPSEEAGDDTEPHDDDPIISTEETEEVVESEEIAETVEPEIIDETENADTSEDTETPDETEEIPEVVEEPEEVRVVVRKCGNNYGSIVIGCSNF